jgi:uncharacterized protein YuzE
MNRIDGTKLLALMMDAFTIEDLKDLCFKLDIAYEDVPGGEVRSAKGRELIIYCSNHGRTRDLLKFAREMRPRLDWMAVWLPERGAPPAKAPSAAPDSVVEPPVVDGLAAMRAFKNYLDQAWGAFLLDMSAGSGAASLNLTQPGQTAVAPSVPPPSPATLNALDALRELRGYLDGAWNVFINQNIYRNRLNRLIEKELPDIGSKGQNFNQKFHQAYPDLSSEGKELFATVRELTQDDAFESNSHIRRWIEDHPLDKLLPERTPAVAELEKQIGQLKRHLDDWFELYEKKFLPDSRQSLVYPGVEEGRHAWPPGVEPATDAVIAELSKGEMRVGYDRQTDTLTLVFSEAAPAESAEGKPGVLLDYDAQGNLVSLKILEASRRVEVPTRVAFKTV